MHFLHLLTAASLATANVLPRGGFRGGKNVPNKEYPKFTKVSLDEAKQGKFREVAANASHAHMMTGRTAPEESLQVTRTITPEILERQTADAAACSANPNIRFEWRDYSDSDRLAFVQAVKCLMDLPPSGDFTYATSRFEDFARLHQMYMNNVHNNAKFLVWHRYFLWAFEQSLRNECGFDRAMVWWDETLDAGAFAESTLFTDTLYFGSLPAPVNGDAVCITNGEFADLTCEIGPGTADTPHCLNRAVDESDTAECSTDYINYCNTITDYASFEQCIEYGVHAYGHDGIGGVMSDVSASPSDPIFWLHHTFVDHSWRIWQNADVVRIEGIDGTDVNGNELTLDTIVYMGGIVPDVPISSIINTLGGVDIGGTPFCYRYNY